jgi:hypothetical protein
LLDALGRLARRRWRSLLKEIKRFGRGPLRNSLNASQRFGRKRGLVLAIAGYVLYLGLAWLLLRPMPAFLRAEAPSASPPPSASAGAITTSPPPSTVSPGLSPSPSPTPSESGSPSPAPSASTESVGATLTKTIETTNSTIKDFALALFVLLLVIPLTAVLAVRTIWELWRLVARRQLVIDDISDATGDEKLAKALPGLSERFREDVFLATERYVRQINERQGNSPGVRLPKAPTPSKAAAAGLAELTTALKDSAPEAAKLPLVLLGAIFPPEGRRVTSSLQLVGSQPRRFGMSVQIADMARPAATQLASVWGVTPQNPVPPGEPPLPDGDARAISKIALSFWQAARWAEAEAKFTAALEKNPTYPYAGEGLVQMLARPSIQERGFLEPAARWLALRLTVLAFLEELR